MNNQTNTQLPITLTVHWLDQFHTHLQNTYSASATVRTALQHINVFTKWFEAKFNSPFTPEAITNYALRQYQKHSLDEARVSPNTWNSRLWALDIFTKWIEAERGASYSDLLVGCKNKEHGIRPAAYRSLTDKEIHDLMQQLERNIRGSITTFDYQVNVRDAAIVTLMLKAGLRVAEVAALDQTDITINERSSSVKVRNGKGSKERILPLNLEARNAISEHRKISTAAALFGGKNSERLSTRQIERIVNYIGAQIHVPEMSPHWLRYTFAKCLERASTPIATIAKALGHANIETTKKYLEASYAEIESAMERM